MRAACGTKNIWAIARGNRPSIDCKACLKKSAARKPEPETETHYVFTSRMDPPIPPSPYPRLDPWAFGFICSAACFICYPND